MKSHQRVVSYKVTQGLYNGFLLEGTVRQSPLKLSKTQVNSIMDALEGEKYGEFYLNQIRGIKRPAEKINNFLIYFSDVLEKLM